MARPGNNDMSRRRRQFEVMAKSDFVFACAQRGWTVRQQKTVREGWNDSHDTFVGNGDTEVMVSQKMKGDRVDWNDCFDVAEREFIK